jgi:MFS family permease
MLQVGFGLSPVTSGSITFVGAIGAVAMRSMLAKVVRRHGFRFVLSVSAVAGALAVAGFSLMGPQTPHWMILLWVFFFGLTRSSQFMTSNTLSYSDMPDSHLSRATSLGGVLQQLSVSFGVSVSALLLALVSRHVAVPSPARFHEAFLLSALIPLLAIPGFLTLASATGVQPPSIRKQIAEAEGES